MDLFEGTRDDGDLDGVDRPPAEPPVLVEPDDLLIGATEVELEHTADDAKLSLDSWCLPPAKKSRTDPFVWNFTYISISAHFA